ncbi:MAG: aminotransferase class III-fold pyridoxal phosphate-dependent enzyme, partial [Planctomycetes bacterium]|nr:aminotransferase class III-fold pyridoxal phosphate-dependent enzyme [Planctomycetota bacterium]
EIACVLTDLMPHRVGLRPADQDYIEALREWTDKDGSLLVFDEVITFRSTYGGAQKWYPVTPDLTAMGKMIGGGFPVGAIAGRAQVMDVMNPLADKVLFPHSGTFSANPITMTAGLVTMQHFDEAAVKHVNALNARAMNGIIEAIAQTGIKACVTGGGSMFRIHMKEQIPTNYREAYASPEEAARLTALLDHLFQEGFIMVNTGSALMATTLTNDHIDSLVAAIQSGFEKVR